MFMPGDWLRNAKLRRCSLAERGAWIEVMCLLHDSDTYGVLHWPLKEIAAAANVPLPTIKALAAKDVLKGCDTGACAGFSFVPTTGRKENDPVILLAAQEGPVWYSSRMLRDEYIRQVRADAGGSKRNNFAEQSGGKGDASTSAKCVQSAANAKATAPMQGEEVTTLSGKGEGRW